jgi:hypothetical protein
MLTGGNDPLTGIPPHSAPFPYSGSLNFVTLSA